MKIKQLLIWISRFMVLLILFYVFFIGGSMAVSEMIPDRYSEPGLLSEISGLLIIGTTNTILVMGLVLSSRRSGWKLALPLAFAWYGAVTFIMQLETWYFLSSITVDEELLPRLFIMGLPTAFIYIPLAVWILGKWRKGEGTVKGTHPKMPAKQWAWKLTLIAFSYLLLYWLAGYFIAWQNPELRAFYGSPGEILPFRQHTALTLNNDPGLFLFQIFRAMLWTLFALPIIWGSRLSAWPAALLLGLLFSMPQNLGHLLANPLIPNASVRLSHLVETTSSTFVFALIIYWLLHRKHYSLQDLFGSESSLRKVPADKKPEYT